MRQTPRSFRLRDLGHVDAPRRILGLVLLAMVLAPGGGAYAGDSDQEALPPATFFSKPDRVTAAEIEDLISNSFADRNKTPIARNHLVHRYKLLAVPRLVLEVRPPEGKGVNQAGLWNALLTLGALRDVHGPAPQLWPALEPINRTMSSSSIFDRTFAALALGSWHWPEGDRPDRKDVGSILEDPTPRMKAQMKEALRRLADAAGDFNPNVRVAALLGLAKRGGPRAALAARDVIGRLTGAAAEVEWAALLTQAFLRERTGAPYLGALASGDRGSSRAGGLAIAVGALQEGSAELDWIKDPSRMLAALEKSDLNSKDGPELVFARGVLIWKRQLTERWKDLWKIATSPRSDTEVAVAATQALLFCRQDWFEQDLMTSARGQSGRTLARPVLAAFLLRAAARGNADGVGAAARYLNQPGRRPKGTRAWDVRFHAAAGLARAFASGDLTEPDLRSQALDALRGGLRSVHKDAPFRAALARWLEAHEGAIRADRHYRPPHASVRALEQSFTCPHALLSRDLVDVCVHRVNRLTLRLFGAHNVQPTSGDSPEKANTPLLLLRAHMEAFPYFSRLEFQWRRGARDLPSLSADDPRSIDR